MGNLRVVTRLIAGLKRENHRPGVVGGGIQGNPVEALSTRRRNGDRCMSTRTLLRLTFLAGLAAPWCAFALGVGPLAVRSALNENLNADIPLIVSNPAELMGLTVRIPQQQEFDRAGIERLATFSKLRVTVQTPPGGPNLVKITSVEPIRNPNFNLLLELAWPRGRLIREFTVQLDPELYDNRRPPPPPLPLPVVPPPSVAAPTPAATPRPALNLPPAPQVSLDGASTYGPVRPGETLSGIAGRMRPASGMSTPQMMAILLAANPQAFINGDPNALRKGAVLRVPSAQALSGQSVAESPPPAVSDLSVPPPATPDGAATLPPPPAPGPVTPTVDATPAQPPAAPLPPPIPPLPAPTPTPPSVVETPAAPSPAPLPVGQQPQEIVPQASIPQVPATGAPVSPLPPVESSPTTAASTVTATATPPPNTTTSPVTPPSGTTATPATPPEPPKPAALPPPVKAPIQPVVEPESSWFENPVIWLASALLLLAMAALVLLPLLRRRAQPSVAPVGPAVEPVTGRPSAAQLAAPPADSPTRVVRPLDPAVLAALGASAPAAPAAPEPSSVSNLLRDIDLGVSNLPLTPSDTVPQAVDRVDRRTPLPDTEPATASDYQKSSIPAMTLAKPSEPVKAPPARSELPTELQFDGMDFDFGDMKLQQTGSQPIELAPLEMKPAGLGSKAGGLAASPIDRMEPATEPASSSGAAMAAILAADETLAMEFKPGASVEQPFELDVRSMRSQPSELLPLEMKPTPSDQELLDRLPRGIDRPEPATEPGTFSGVSDILSAQSAADAEISRTQVKQPPAPGENKFDFSDITQEFGRQTDDISLTKLDEDLRSFGDKTLELAPMDAKSLPVMPENAMADYMETKLDLAMAYLDMGDQMGARSLLETVLQEGDASQKQRANDILKKIV